MIVVKVREHKNLNRGDIVLSKTNDTCDLDVWYVFVFISVRSYNDNSVILNIEDHPTGLNTYSANKWSGIYFKLNDISRWGMKMAWGRPLSYIFTPEQLNKLNLGIGN